MKKKSFLSRFLMIALAILAVIATITFVVVEQGFSASSGQLQGINVDNITAKYETNWDKNPWSSSSKTISGSISSTEGTCSDTHYSTTLVITYEGDFSGSTNPKITFDYNYTKNSGSLSIGGKAVPDSTSVSDFEYEFTPNNKTLEITMKSGSKNPTTLSITSIACILNKDITINFKSLMNSEYNTTYLVNDTVVEDDLIVTCKDYNIFKLEANQIDGYKFIGWSANEILISSEMIYSTRFANDSIVFPIYTTLDKPVFQNNGKIYYDLNEANENAVKENVGEIRLISTGTLQADTTYNISNGVILNIPNSSQYYMNLSVPSTDIFKDVNAADKKNRVFRELILPENTIINVESGGIIYIGGEVKTKGGSGGLSAYVNGDYGCINLITANSKIVLNGKAELFCYGYIKGAGTVEAHSESVVYELFQIGNFRGGSASFKMYNNSQRVFPFNQYFVQNIESNLKLFKGANLKTASGVYASSSVQAMQFNFLGDDGIFKMLSENAYIARKYDSTTDTIFYQVYGECCLSPIELSLNGISINSSKYVLPITNNMDIRLLSGSTLNINQEMCMLPGSKLTVDEGASVSFAKNCNIYVYDRDSWIGKGFIGAPYGDLATVNYSASLDGKPMVRLNNIATLPDAEIDNNGNVLINNEASIYVTNFYNTANEVIICGANIHSSMKTGKFQLAQGVGQIKDTYQATQFGSTITFVPIPVSSLLLRNGEGGEKPYDDKVFFDPSEYREDIAGKQIFYDDNLNAWTFSETGETVLPIKYVNREDDKVVQTTYPANKDFKLPLASEVDFSCRNLSLKGWLINYEIYSPGQICNLGYTLNAEAVAVWGGWVTLNNGSGRFYIDYTSGEFLRGLNRVESYDHLENELSMFLFDDEGLFLSDFTNYFYNSSDSKYYLVIKGVVVEEPGFESFTIDVSANPILDYVYITKNNSLLVGDELGTEYYVQAKEGDPLPSGKYTFDNNGLIVKEFPDMITNGAVQMEMNIENSGMFIDGIRVPYGLFLNSDNYYYYSNNDGQIVKNQTFYVEKTNDYNISKGLYYFDAEGRLCDQKTLEPVVGGVAA